MYGRIEISGAYGEKFAHRNIIRKPWVGCTKDEWRYPLDRDF